MQLTFSSPEARIGWLANNAAANVFHLTQAQYTQLESDNWTEYESTYLHPPFPIFAIVIDEPLWIPTIDDGSRFTRTLRLLVDARQSEWIIAEQSSITTQGQPIRTLVFGTGFNAETGDAYRLNDATELPSRELARIIRISIGFILALQHKAVAAERIIDPNRPISRQIRRAEGYIDSEHYAVILRPRVTIEKILRQVNQSDGLKYMRPHGVRGHLRRLPNGRIIPVRAHKRGDRNHIDVISYDATRLEFGGITSHSMRQGF